MWKLFLLGIILALPACGEKPKPRTKTPEELAYRRCLENIAMAGGSMSQMSTTCDHLAPSNRGTKP